MRLFEKNPALLIIDMQKGFDDQDHWGGNRNNPQAETNVRRLLERWRELRLPIFHIQHCSTEPRSPLRPDHPGNEIKEQVRPLPGEPVIQKQVNSAFIGTDLEKRLRQHKIESVILTGIQTDHCVSTTARMAGNLGFNTYVVSDGTATFDRAGYDGKHYTSDLIHTLALVSLQNEFAAIIDTQSILFQMQPSQEFSRI